YTPEAYFGRVDDLYLNGRLDIGQGTARYWRRHPLRWLKRQASNLTASAVLFWRLMTRVPEGSLRREYPRRIWRVLQQHPHPALVLRYLGKCVMHYHAHTMTKRMIDRQSPVYSTM